MLITVNENSRAKRSVRHSRMLIYTWVQSRGAENKTINQAIGSPSKNNRSRIILQLVYNVSQCVVSIFNYSKSRMSHNLQSKFLDGRCFMFLWVTRACHSCKHWRVSEKYGFSRQSNCVIWWCFVTGATEN